LGGLNPVYHKNKFLEIKPEPLFLFSFLFQQVFFRLFNYSVQVLFCPPGKIWSFKIPQDLLDFLIGPVQDSWLSLKIYFSNSLPLHRAANFIISKKGINSLQIVSENSESRGKGF